MSRAPSPEPGDGRLLVYPGFDALYASFYLHGLERHATRRGERIVYTRRGFPDLDHDCLAFVLDGHRVCLSAYDRADLDSRGLAWCDVYGQVNLDPEIVRRDAPETPVVALGPSFPVQVWAPPEAWVLGGANLLRRGGAGSWRRGREHLANYWRQHRYRLPLEAYVPAQSVDDYVFFAGTLWRQEPATNQARAAFVEAVRAAPGVELEGGFVPRQRGAVPGFEHLTTTRRYPMEEYHEKIGRSAVVFNTPAVLSCHGWKLGEFLARGKAIVSTPLTRALPAPLEHGVHVHFVPFDPARPEGFRNAVGEAVAEILGDPGYRRRLELGARDYYCRHLTPQRVLERLVDSAAQPTRGTPS